MRYKKVHYLSGLTLTVFVGIHLFNHVLSIYGAETHIEWMEGLRLVYRNPMIESVLFIAVVVQIITGIRLFQQLKKNSTKTFEKIQLWTGIYLAFFLLIHVGAVLTGRWVLALDTNFYFGVAGMNSFPFNLFFIPYYLFAIISFFGHIAGIHAKKMKLSVFGISPVKQASLIFLIGIVISVIILYGSTNHFRGVSIPEEYGILIGK